ncbi:MAG TPA: restriction endonuclease subunit S [Chitinophagales bacterium]|nr:restriction endonuclease subunit S [Chitinophagales bacterium]
MQAEGTANIKLQELTERPGYKKTKLGWIPEEWSTPTISEVFQFLRTTSFSRNQMNYDEIDGVHCIHYGDIHATYRRPILDFNENSEIPKINKDVELSSNIDLLEDGDLIIADASEDYEGIGTAIELTNLNGKEVLSGLHTFAFRDDKGKTVRGFRTYLFRNPQVKKALKTIATGSKVYGVSKGNLEKFRIVLPTPPEQQKIAKIFSTWDTAITTQEQLITAKETFKKGLMQVLLTGKVRFEGFEGEWENESIGSFGKVISGLTYSPDNVKDTGLLVLRSSNVQNRRLEYVDNVFVDIKDGAYNPVMENDILICVRNGSKNLIGKNAKIGKEAEGMAFGAFMSVYRSSRNDYVFHLFDTDFYKREIHRNLGATINSINGSNLKKFRFPFPKAKERAKITELLNAQDKEIALLKQQLVQLQDQKLGLMQRLLTGEVRVKIDNK